MPRIFLFCYYSLSFIYEAPPYCHHHTQTQLHTHMHTHFSRWHLERSGTAPHMWHISSTISHSLLQAAYDSFKTVKLPPTTGPWAQSICPSVRRLFPPLAAWLTSSHPSAVSSSVPSSRRLGQTPPIIAELSQTPL